MGTASRKSIENKHPDRTGCIRAIFQMYAGGHRYTTLVKTLSGDPTDAASVALSRVNPVWRVPKHPSGRIGEEADAPGGPSRNPSARSSPSYLKTSGMKSRPARSGAPKLSQSDRRRALLSPRSPKESKYLLSSLACSSLCGSNIAALGGKRNHYYYDCSYHHSRGASVCVNDHKVRVETLDQEILSGPG